MRAHTAFSALRRTCAAAMLALPALALAAYPEKPITIIVPFAAGGPTDVLTRVIAERMARELAQPMIVENTPGAGGTVGNARAARAKPDGYTVLAGNVGTLAPATRSIASFHMTCTRTSWVLPRSAMLLR